MSLKRKFIICLIVMVLINIGLRLAVSGSLDNDEAEQLFYFQQHFQLGYNTQPPLYNWIQLVFFSIFGLNVFALTLFKNTLIFVIYYFIFKSSRLILKDDFFAVLSTISLMLVYEFHWVLHKDLTHTVLLMAISAVTLFLFLKMITTNNLKYYTKFGICVGLGILSKYNFLFFAIILLLTALSMKRFRRAVLDKRLLLSFLISALIVLPHALWAIQNTGQAAVDVKAFEMAADNARSFGFAGLFKFITGIMYFVTPLFIFLLIFFSQGFKRYQGSDVEKTHIKVFFERFFLFAFGLSVLLILLLNVTQIQRRWFMPFMFVIPIYFFIRYDNKPIQQSRKVIFIALCVFISSSTIFGVPGRVFFAGKSGNYRRLNYPYNKIAAAIKEEGFQKGLIIAEDHVIGGDLKFYFPDSFVMTPVTRMRFDPDKNFNSVLLVWKFDGREGTPHDINELIRSLGLKLTNKKISVKEALYKYSDKDYYKVYTMTATNFSL